MRRHHGLAIGHSHMFSSIKDWYFAIAWEGGREEMSGAARVGYS